MQYFDTAENSTISLLLSHFVTYFERSSILVSIFVSSSGGCSTAGLSSPGVWAVEELHDIGGMVMEEEMDLGPLVVVGRAELVVVRRPWLDLDSLKCRIKK